MLKRSACVPRCVSTHMAGKPSRWTRSLSTKAKSLSQPLTSLPPAPQPSAPLTRRLPCILQIFQQRSFTGWNELCTRLRLKVAVKPLHQELFMNKWLMIVWFNVASATPLFLSSVDGHDGPLDVYGCHLDMDQKYYHCHEGVYKRLSFDSQTQMVQRLKNQ